MVSTLTIIKDKTPNFMLNTMMIQTFTGNYLVH